MADERGKALDFIGVQTAGNGSTLGPKLNASMFIPNGYGLVFQDQALRWWRLQLALNADGTTYYGDDGKPTLEMNQVEF